MWYLGEERQSYRLLDGREQGHRIVAQLEGVSSREQADGCIGRIVSVPLETLPALPEGEYYWRQLEGLQAVTPSGALLGVVHHLFETGANDVLVIRRGGEEILVPYVPAVVGKVDLDKRLIELDWETDI